MKKLLALLLSLLMVFSMATLLSSCGDSDDDDTESSAVAEEESGKKEKKKSTKKSSKSDEELIIGEWEMRIDYAKFINESLEDEDAPFDASVENAEVKMNWTFDEDGTCKLEMDQKSFEEFFNSYMDKIVDQLTDDPDQKEAFKKEMKDGLEADDSFETQEGKYSFKDGKLYIESDEDEESIFTYKFVSDDEIKITDIESDEEDSEFDLSVMLPLILKRK